MAIAQQKCVFFALFVLCYLSRGVLTLKIFLDVPDKVAMEQSAELKCDYDLEGETLYALRWYKDDVMFYRYDPQLVPSVGIKFYYVIGVNVDRERSTPNHMYITDIYQSTAGVYECEVTTGAPDFRKGSEQKLISIEGFQEGDHDNLDPKVACLNFTVGAPDKKEFYSPIYPFNYPKNITCERQLKAPRGHVIRLKFPKIFSIEQGPKCRYDWLEVRDGRNDNSPLLARLCGHKKPRNIVSTGRYLWLKFHSNPYIQYQGFKAVYKFVPNEGRRRRGRSSPALTGMSAFHQRK